MAVVEILTWVSIGCGGLLVLMLLMSIIGGLDLDFDLDVGSTDIDTDISGGLGFVKSALTFISVSAWIVRVMLVAKVNLLAAALTGLFSGGVAVFILAKFFMFLMRQEKEVNWSPTDALFKTGKVYLKIPANQNASGIVTVNIEGAIRELKAKSLHNKDIPTGAEVMVEEIEEGFAMVYQVEPKQLSA